MCMDTSTVGFKRALNTIRCESEQTNRFLDVISNELGSINKNIEKFLDRNYLQGKDWFLTTKSPSVPELARYCDWCLGEFQSWRYFTCQHATLCEACAPCDDCPPVEVE